MLLFLVVQIKNQVAMDLEDLPDSKILKWRKGRKILFNKLLAYKENVCL